jgi:hypothetical protein
MIFPFRVVSFAAVGITVSRRSNRDWRIKGMMAIAAAQ